MKCSKYISVSDRYLYFSKACRKLARFQTMYAGLIMCFVPLVICESGRRNQLTYDSIYNSTKYAQIQNRRPYQTFNLSYIRPNTENLVNSHSYEDIRDDNELEYEEVDYNKHSNLNNAANGAKLLVGFSYDPYRYSVPEVDYIKGVRSYKPQADVKGERGKRGVGHLYNMIYCATGCEPLSYKGYGCYCGFLGEGRPTDPIDRCCQMHDKCYENLFCPFFTVYFQPYYWKCYHGEPLCALENHSTRNQLINGCAGRLCECDRLLAMCLRQYRCPRRRALCRSSPLRLLQNVLMAK